MKMSNFAKKGLVDNEDIDVLAAEYEVPSKKQTKIPDSFMK